MRVFLNLPEELTQVWLHKYIVVLVLMLLKVVLFTKMLALALASNKTVAKSLCESYEQLLQQAQRTPEIMLAVFGSVTNAAVQNTKKEALMLLKIAISIIKALISFVIELYLGTFTCLCTAFVKGALHIVTDATRDIVHAVDKAVNAFLKAFNKSLDGLSTLVNGVLTTIQAVKSLFSHNKSDQLSGAVNSVNLTASTLKNISIPTGFIDDLSNLTEKIPDFQHVLSNVTHTVNRPLDLLEQDVTRHVHLSGLLLLPQIKSVPQNGTCWKLDGDFDKAIAGTHKLSQWIVLGLCLGVLVVLLAAAFGAFRSYRRKIAIIDELALAPSAMQTGNLLDANKNKVALFFLHKNVDYRLKWFGNYCFTSLATTVLFLGLAGLLLVGLQYMVLCQAKLGLSKLNSTQFQNSTHHEVSRFLDNTQHTLDSTAETLNEQLFGSIDNTTENLHHHLESIEDSINNTISSIFHNTPFGSAVHSIVYCTIGRKIEELDDGLQWLHKHLEILFPEINKQQLLRQMQQKESDDSPMSHIKSILDSVINSYQQSLLVELIIASSLCGCWLLIAVFGGLILLIRQFSPKNKISEPKPLSDEEKQHYQYPVSDPYERTSSVYSSNISHRI